MPLKYIYLVFPPKNTYIHFMIHDAQTDTILSCLIHHLKQNSQKMNKKWQFRKTKPKPCVFAKIAVPYCSRRHGAQLILRQSERSIQTKLALPDPLHVATLILRVSLTCPRSSLPLSPILKTPLSTVLFISLSYFP